MNRLSVLLLLVTGLVTVGYAPSAQAQLLTPVAATADVSASLTASYDDDLLVGIRNAGPYEVDASVEIELPSGIDVVRLPAGCGLDGATLRCVSDALLPDAYTTFPVDIVQTSRAVQHLTAVASGDREDPAPGNNRASLSVERLAAPAPTDDVVEAAVTVSRLRFPDGAPAGGVVLSRDDGFADALAGTPLTGDAPLLYTGTEQLDPRTAAEIDRLLPGGGDVRVLGGAAAVAEGVVRSLEAAGHRVERLAGSSRVQTALVIADEVVADGGSSTVVVARSDGDGTAAWADSVAIGGLAAMTRTPVLLTPTSALPEELARWIGDHGVSRSLVVGGESAVATSTVSSLPGVERVSGSDRAATAVAISRLYPMTRAADDHRFHLVNGYDEQGWAFGLVAAGLAAEEGAPILFVDTTAAPEASVEALRSCRDRPVPMAVVGGTAQVAPELYTELDRLDVESC